MSRFVTAVRTGPDNVKARLDGEEDKPAEQYLERIGKYVPSEIIAAYTGLNALLVTFPDSIRYYAYFVCFVLCLVLTPFYFKLIAKPEDKPSLNYQMVISSIAFLVWSYAIDGGGGIFGENILNIYHQSVGGALLIVFSLISGAFIPRK